MYPTAHDRNQPCGVPPGHEILSFLARLREEPESDEGSSPDEGVPEKFAGHRTYEGWRRLRTTRILRRSVSSISGEVAAWFSCLSIFYGLDFGTGMFLALHDALWD